MATYTPSQLASASNATYTTNGSGSITGATVRSLNTDWISSSILVSQTGSMTVLSASYAGTASVLLGSVVSASYAATASVLLGSVVSASYAITADTASALNVVAGATDFGYFLLMGSGSSVAAIKQVYSDGQVRYNPTTDTLYTTNIRATSKLETTGSVNISGSAYGNVVAVTVSSNTASIDLASGNFFTVTLANSATTFFNVTNPLPGVSANLILTTGTVSSASFSSNVKQPSGSVYLPTSGSGQIDALSLVAVDSSNVYLVASKKFV